MTIWFDLESAGQGEARVRAVTKPPKPAAAWPEFDPASVKCGNCGGQDSEKGKKKIADAKMKHEEDGQKAADDAAAAEKAYWADKIADAALHAECGRVVVIGCLSADQGKLLIIGEQNPDEATILKDFWAVYIKMKATRRKMIGVNILSFDLPFLITRSWVLDVPVPGTVCERKGRYVNFDPLFVDLREMWLMGRKWGDCESSLDHMVKTLGLGSKTDGEAGKCSGATFAAMWESGDPEQRAAARAYLVNDLQLPKLISARMGIV